LVMDCMVVAPLQNGDVGGFLPIVDWS